MSVSLMTIRKSQPISFPLSLRGKPAMTGEKRLCENKDCVHKTTSLFILFLNFKKITQTISVTSNFHPVFLLHMLYI